MGANYEDERVPINGHPVSIRQCFIRDLHSSNFYTLQVVTLVMPFPKLSQKWIFGDGTPFFGPTPDFKIALKTAIFKIFG